MNINVFRRVEEKYLISEEQKDKLFDLINNYIKEDEYFESTICNIYFDNRNRDLIINSLEKPIYKDKIRLRSYNIPTLSDIVYLEIKNKYKGIVGKRRIKLTLEEFYNYVDKGILPNDSQIMKEIDYLFHYYDLVPNIYIAYDRKSYKGCFDNDLRITFDNNLRSRDNDLRLEDGDSGIKYFSSDYYIMEVKTLGSIPLWFAHSLSSLNIYPTSFSKYGKIYLKEMEGDE